MVVIDGSMGEGGGQILRTGLALSVCFGEPIQIHSIRQARQRPGLRPQHLAAVRAAAEISRADVRGQVIGASELVFVPGPATPGDYRFDIGTAGSANLVLQTVLPALSLAPGDSRLMITGGTHNERAPTFEFMDLALLPILRRIGMRCDLSLLRPGYYPAGGGAITADIRPARDLTPLQLEARGQLVGLRAVARISRLPEHIARRELDVLRQELPIRDDRAEIQTDLEAAGPGNVLHLIATSEHVTEVFCGFGRRGLPAERVAAHVVTHYRRYLNADAAVGPHLSDQLLLPMVLAGGGRFTTVEPSSHTRTNAALLEQFTKCRFDFQRVDIDRWLVTLQPQG